MGTTERRSPKSVFLFSVCVQGVCVLLPPVHIQVGIHTGSTKSQDDKSRGTGCPPEEQLLREKREGKDNPGRSKGLYVCCRG